MPITRKRAVFAAVFVAHTLGILSSIDALMSTRTAPGAVAWIVSLSTFPYVTVPVYWVFGRNRFNGYVIGRREDQAEPLHGLELRGDHLERLSDAVEDQHRGEELNQRVA